MKFCKTFKNTYFEEPLQTGAFNKNQNVFSLSLFEQRQGCFQMSTITFAFFFSDSLKLLIIIIM